MMRRLIPATRYLVLAAVLGAFAAAATMLIKGLLEAAALVALALTGGHGPGGIKVLILHAIEVVDLLLLGTVFYIISLGLYELFIDDRLPLPRWMEIHDLDGLKDKLASVVVVVMGVMFLGQVVTWDGERDLLGLGAGVALVMAALTWFLAQKKKG